MRSSSAPVLVCCLQGEEAVRESGAPTSSSELKEFETELQATLGALEQQESAHTPDEDKVHAV